MAARTRDRSAKGAPPAEPRFTAAIVGRPNVGKSTLFNRLVGKRLALVDDRPGVTRDLREGLARLGDLRFTIVDTAGVEDAEGDVLPARMRRLTERAVDQADIALFVVDARVGITEADRSVAETLRRRAERVVLLANKAEGAAGDAGALEAYALGLGDPVAISAEHGEGLEDLYSALRPISDAMDEAEAWAEAQAEAAETSETAAAAVDGGPGSDGDADKPIRIAVVGRPNAGKSTLVNAILGEDRLLTGPEAGITRDAIGLDVDWGGRAFKIFDTAGMRRKAKVQEKLEKLSVADGLRAVRFAEVVIALFDAEQPFESQDLRIADLAEREGRAVVVGLSKWDLIPNKQARLAEHKEAFDRLLPQLRGAPLVALSSVSGKGIDRLRDAVVSAHAAWDTRVPTAALNRWLRDVVAKHPPPAPSGRRIKLRYMTQAKSRPPTFVVFASKPDALPESYVRYLANALRERFGMEGAPVRILVRAGENPYAAKAKPHR